MSTTTSPARNSPALSRKDLLDTWRKVITADQDIDPTDAVVAELMDYYKLSKDEVIHRCQNWEDISVEEWKSDDRSTPEGILNFYQTQTSWIFDTMRYHADQCKGACPPESVDIVEGLSQRLPDWRPGCHLDFGSGPGTTSLFFQRLGWDISLADVSTTFLEFARWRLARHQAKAKFYDSSRDQLPRDAFDLVTALDVMVHVADIRSTLGLLNASLKPGGYLVFNIDNRPRTERTECHLYSEQFPILRLVRQSGFERCAKIDYFHVYRKVQRSSAENAMLALADSVRYNSFTTIAGKAARRLIGR